VSGIEGIIDIQIDRKTSAVSQKSFGVLLFVGIGKAFASTTSGRWRVREYTSLTAVQSDFADTTAEYKAAAKWFGQAIKPAKMLIGQAWTVSGTLETIATTLAAIAAENSDWYGLAIYSRTSAIVSATAAWIEADANRQFFTASADPDIANVAPGSDNASVWASLKAFARTDLFYHTTAASEFPEIAVASVAMIEQPGSATLKFKKLSGVVADNLTDTQEGTLRAKKTNFYTTVGGVAIVQEGSNLAEWFDVMFFVDWMRARMSEGVFGVFVRAKKVPFTDAGVAMIESEIRRVLKQGITIGGIAPETYDIEGNQKGGFTVTTVPVSEISANDKAARKYDGLSFVAYLGGAIHSATVRGVVTY